MSANLSSTNGNFLTAQTETVLVQRRSVGADNPLGEPTFGAPLTIYNGPADLQELTGDIEESKAGFFEEGPANLYIEATDPAGLQLPAILDGDKVTWVKLGVTATYVVEHVYLWAFPYPHLKAELRRGAAW